MPAFCRINNIDFKSIKIQETAGPMLPAALVSRKVEFISMFRASNDEVTEQAAAKLGIRLSRVFMAEEMIRSVSSRKNPPTHGSSQA
jgi:hypothetical protein